VLTHGAMDMAKHPGARTTRHALVFARPHTPRSGRIPRSSWGSGARSGPAITARRSSAYVPDTLAYRPGSPPAVFVWSHAGARAGQGARSALAGCLGRRLARARHGEDLRPPRNRVSPA
jgi:hypothetical protein